MKKSSVLEMMLVVIAAVLLVPISDACAQPTVFNKVKVRSNKSQKDPRLVDKDGDLTFDNLGRKLLVKSVEWPLDVPYDSVQKVVFDVTTHMRGGAMSQMLGGVSGAILASKHVEDYWFHISYKTPGGESKTYVVEIDRDSSAKVIEEAKAAFGDRVVITEFDKAEKIEKETLKDLQSKHDLKVDKKNHPLPELKRDKALIVVVCPPLAARYAGKGTQVKLHANDRVVVVNKMGTYSFAYLDPGEYTLASQSENVSAMKMKLEAGHEYYFLQDTFMGMMKARTGLSRHAKELVMHELSGAYHADWKRK